MKKFLILILWAITPIIIAIILELLCDLVIKVFFLYTFLKPQIIKVFYSECKWLRKNGLSKDIIIDHRIPNLTAENIVKVKSKAIHSYRLIYTIFAAGYVIWKSGGALLSAVAAILTYKCVRFMGEEDISQINPSNGDSIRNGIYKINFGIFGITLSGGIGTTVNNVLHVPYHVSHGKAVFIGKKKLNPYLIDSNKDIVTYGGPPQFTTVNGGDTVCVNCETKESRRSYQVIYSLDVRTGNFTWPCLTKPGESGSPVYVRDENGNLQLVGLAGQYIQTGDSQSRTEYCLKPEIPVPNIE